MMGFWTAKIGVGLVGVEKGSRVLGSGLWGYGFRVSGLGSWFTSGPRQKALPTGEVILTDWAMKNKSMKWP